MLISCFSLHKTAQLLFCYFQECGCSTYKRAVGIRHKTCVGWLRGIYLKFTKFAKESLFAHENIFYVHQFRRFGHGYSVENTPNIVNAVDLQTIENKVKNFEYETALEYLNDIRWIRHNVSVIPGKKFLLIQTHKHVSHLVSPIQLSSFNSNNILK